MPHQPQRTTVTLAGNAAGKDGRTSLARGHFNLLSEIISTALAMPWLNPPLREVTRPPDDSAFREKGSPAAQIFTTRLVRPPLVAPFC